MILNIKAVQDKSMGCAEVLVVTVVSWWRRYHELMFVESWGFGYQPPEEEKPSILGHRISPAGGNLLELLRKYHGVELVPHDTKKATEVLEVVRRELTAGRPVFISIDSFWCPWDIGYLKHHNMHGCLVVGLDGDETSLYCIDGYYIKDVGRLPIASFQHGCGPCATFHICGEQALDIDWREVVVKAVFRLKGNTGSDAFEAMRSFAKEIENSLKLDAEGVGFENNFWDCPLLNQILSIGRGRVQFAGALRLLSKLNGVNGLLPLAERLEKIGWQWTAVRSMLIKEQMMPDPAVTIGTVVTKIKEAAVEEERIAGALLEISREEGVISGSGDTVARPTVEKRGELIFAGLDGYFNNEGIGSSLVEKCTADLFGTKTFILAESLPPNAVWTVGEMKFRFPAAADGMKDNISCAGQVIKLPPGCYGRVMVLGCSECSNYSGWMVVHYQDGQTEEIKLGLTDWCFQPVFGETTAWRGKAAERVGGEVQTLSYEVRLYAQSYDLKQNRMIIELRLPDCPNMHIFAITLV